MLLALMTACNQCLKELEEIGDFGQRIKSKAFAPGIIDTDMQAVIRASNMPKKNMFKKENLTSTKPAAHLATWLASGKADDLAGKDLDLRDEAVIKRMQ